MQTNKEFSLEELKKIFAELFSEVRPTNIVWTGTEAELEILHEAIKKEASKNGYLSDQI